MPSQIELTRDSSFKLILSFWDFTINVCQSVHFIWVWCILGFANNTVLGILMVYSLSWYYSRSWPKY